AAFVDIAGTFSPFNAEEAERANMKDRTDKTSLLSGRRETFRPDGQNVSRRPDRSLRARGLRPRPSLRRRGLPLRRAALPTSLPTQPAADVGLRPEDARLPRSQRRGG